jgi:hypothetical protein
MTTDLTVVVEDKPGTFARIAEALGKAGINIEGGSATVFQGQGICHFLVTSVQQARTAIEGAGGRITAETPVVVTSVGNQPGELGRITQRIAQAGINLEFVYGSSQQGVVFGARDVTKLKELVAPAAATR